MMRARVTDAGTTGLRQIRAFARRVVVHSYASILDRRRGDPYEQLAVCALAEPPEPAGQHRRACRTEPGVLCQIATGGNGCPIGHRRENLRRAECVSALAGMSS
jgi:hypothetical protein